MTGLATTRAARMAALEVAATDRILVLDGAMGTMIQAWAPDTADWSGGCLAGHTHDLTGDNDVLNLSRPDMIEAIHRAYLEAGADIVATNTFNATSISQADYGAAHFAYDINRSGAEIARRAADAVTAADPTRPRFVAGAIGPTSKTCSISPDVNDPGFRAVTFEDIRVASAEAARGLIDGGADMLLVETIFDTLNAKAVIYALEEVFEEVGARLPVMLSGTITDLSGRTLTGQTVEAFWNAIAHARPFTVGLNCSLGAHELRPYVAELSRVADTRLCAYPNAGLPNEFGQYDEAPEETARHLGEWARSGLVNVVGGCCGTTPEHISAIAAAVAGVVPRPVPLLPPRLRLSGLEAFEVRA